MMDLCFWGLLLLIRKGSGMENPFDLGHIPPLFDSSSDIDGSWDFYFNFNQFATHSVDLPPCITNPSDQNPHPSSPGVLIPSEPGLIIPDQLNHSPLRHNPFQTSLSHNALSESGSASSRMSVHLPQDEHPSSPFSSVDTQHIHSSQLPGSENPIDKSLHGNSPLFPIQEGYPLVRPGDFHQTKDPSNLDLDLGHPNDPKAITLEKDGFENNRHAIPSKVKLKSPTTKSKLNNEDARVVNSKTSTKISSTSRKVTFNYANPTSPDHTQLIPDVSLQREIQKCYNFSFTLIDFEPLTIDGMMVLEALKNLKFPNGTKFFNIPTTHTINNFYSENQDQFNKNEIKSSQKLFYLYLADGESMDEFCDFFYQAMRLKAYEGVSRSTHEKKKDRQIHAQRAWDNLIYTEYNDQNSMILSYKEFVLNEFAELVADLRSKINLFFHDEIDRKYFHATIKLFPVYLLYVDMINAIAPVGNVDIKGEFLKSPRKQAGIVFFQILDRIIFFPDNRSEPASLEEAIISELIVIFEERNIFSRQNGSPLVWRLVRYWMLTARKNLLVKSPGGPSRNFKHFWNSMAYDLLDKS